MVRKLAGIILAAIMVFSFCGISMADTAITVNGSGKAFLDADTAVISLGVNARDKDVLAAQGRVNEIIASIRAALIANGVAKEDINTDFLNVHAIYDYIDDQSVVAAYSANSNLAIKTMDMDMAGKIIDIAFEAGANTLNGVSFSASDTSQASADALEKAVRNATEKARVLAEAAGLTITGISAINESGTYSYNYDRMDAVVDGNIPESAGTEVQAAKLTVSASVSITFSAECQN